MLLKRNLAVAYVSALGIALLLAVASLIGIVNQSQLYSGDLRPSFATSDAMNLILGLPVLLVSLWSARRGQRVGRLCLPGAIFYVLYVYVPYLIAIPFNSWFLIYVAIVATSASTLIAILASMDGNAVRDQLGGRVPARASGGILTALALVILLRQVTLVLSALANRSPVSAQELAVWIDDLIVACPALLIVGMLLWQRAPLGYVAGGGLLLAYAMLSIAVIPLFVVESLSTYKPVDAGSVVVLLFMAAICLVPFAFFVRGAIAKPSVSTAALTAQG